MDQQWIELFVFFHLLSIKQVDDGIVVKAILPPALPQTVPTVDGHKLHLCLCDTHTKANRNTHTHSRQGGGGWLSYSVMCDAWAFHRQLEHQPDVSTTASVTSDQWPVPVLPASWRPAALPVEQPSSVHTTVHRRRWVTPPPHSSDAPPEGQISSPLTLGLLIL